MNKLDIIGDTTPSRMIEAKYVRAKYICLNMWDNPNSKWDFEDIFHDTIYRCLRKLGDDKLPQDYMKNYFFKAFRINMIRYFGYAYNKYKSGADVEEVVIPVLSDYDAHIDGFEMLDYVEKTYGPDHRNMLWDNLNGITYKDLDKIYKTNSFYCLGKIKNQLKSKYADFIYVKAL